MDEAEYTEQIDMADIPDNDSANDSSKSPDNLNLLASGGDGGKGGDLLDPNLYMSGQGGYTGSSNHMSGDGGRPGNSLL